jgi:hypothetical protein
MNKRIEELKAQAGIADNPDPEGLTQFAELLIQDCADLAYQHNIFSRGRPWNLVIKEHFDIAVTDEDRPPHLRNIGVDK